MIKEYENNRSKLIDEIYTRSYTKNYLHPAFLKDDLDYITSCLKASLGRYVMLSRGSWDKQTSVSTAMNKYLRYLSIDLKDKYLIGAPKSEYQKFIELCDEITSEMCSKWVRKNEYYNLYSKNETISYIKHFIMIVNDKTLYEQDLQYSDYIKERLPKYKNIYIKCRKQANENVKTYKDLIYHILYTAFSTVNFDMEDKQIIKYVNNKIRWMFLQERTKLRGYKHRKKLKMVKNRIANGKANVGNKREYVLNNWFGINDEFEYDEYGRIKKDDEFKDVKLGINDLVNKIDCLNKNQKQFIVDVVNSINKVDYRKNKKGQWDLNKTQLAERVLGTTYDSLEKKCKRIKDKLILNGFVVDKEYKEEIVIKARCLTPQDMRDQYEINADKQRQIAQDMLDEAEKRYEAEYGQFQITGYKTYKRRSKR